MRSPLGPRTLAQRRYERYAENFLLCYTSLLLHFLRVHDPAGLFRFNQAHGGFGSW